MQRVVIENYPYYAALKALDAKVALIVKHFPPSVASLYALPKAGDGDVLEWWSPLGGQPILYADLDEQQQELLLKKYSQRQQSLQLLIDELNKRGRAEQANTLQSLLGEPNLADLYSINQDPVIVRWGPPPPPPPPPPSTPKPEPAVIKPSVVSPRIVTKVYGRPRWLWPLLLLLLLGLLLGWLVYWWLNHSNIDSYACSPEGTSPPEFVTIFDTSASMWMNLQTSPDDENWYFKTGKKIPGGNERTRKILASPTRIVTAKKALTDMVNNLHADIDVRLISFDSCGYQPDHGVFNAKQRPALLQRIHGLKLGTGTPLAASLAYAASKVDGRNNDAVIFMFIDGQEGCGGNVCEVAETIAREQPRLKVNVLDIGNAIPSSCIAKATGGRIYDTTDIQKISTMLAKATQEVSGSAKCKAIF
ncbi:MAG: VWA domain-containing protein [Oceanisphaera sp.]